MFRGVPIHLPQQNDAHLTAHNAGAINDELSTAYACSTNAAVTSTNNTPAFAFTYLIQEMLSDIASPQSSHVLRTTLRLFAELRTPKNGTRD
jgi:hypothetical protein